jgi:hypothetical protein
MKRPTGVLVIGILGIIGGILGIIGAIGVFTVGSLATAVGAVGVGGFAMVAGVIYLILSIFELIAAIAFLSLKQWAWWGLVILLAANIVWAIVLMIAWQFGASSLISIIIDAAIIYYLNTKGIKSAFFGTASPDLLSKVSGGRLHDDQIMKGN